MPTRGLATSRTRLAADLSDPERATEPNSAARWKLIAGYQTELVPIARARCCCAKDAEDIVQEALLRTACYRDLDDVRAGAFLTTVVMHLAADLNRQRVRSNRLREHRALYPVAARSPEEQVCARADALGLVGLLTVLTPQERQVLLARADGHSTAEIATILHLTGRAVESIGTRGRTRLRRAALTVLPAPRAP